MQLHITIFICIAYTLSVINLQNAGVSSHGLGRLLNFNKCFLCDLLKIRNTSRITTNLPTTSTTVTPVTITTPPYTTEPPKSPSPDNCTDIPEQLPKAEDVISFFSSESTLANISFEGKKSAFSLLCASGLITSNQIPPVVIVNIITMMASSNQLYYTNSDSQMEFNSVLKMITNYPCVLKSLSTKLRIRFLDRLLSLSPGILINIPKSALVSILGTISGVDILTTLPPRAIFNLITALSLSKSVFICLPDKTFVALLKFITTKELFEFLPPSTFFRFYEILIDKLNDGYLVVESPIRTNTLIIQIISPIMSSRMLSVLPIHMYNPLLNIIGSHCNDLAASNFVSLFTTIAKSPIILNSLNPYYLSNVMLVDHNIPLSLKEELTTSIANYLPSVQNYLT